MIASAFGSGFGGGVVTVAAVAVVAGKAAAGGEDAFFAADVSGAEICFDVAVFCGGARDCASAGATNPAAISTNRKTAM